MLGPLMDADRDALARYLDGDEKAFDDIVARHEAKVRMVAGGILRDPALAQDVAQETFLTAYQKAESYRGAGSVRSWLLGIAFRRSLDELRRRRRRSETMLAERSEPSVQPLGELEASWDVKVALSALSPESRTALLLKEVEGLSYREIADALDWPMGTVATKLHRARLELRRILEEERHAMPDR